LRLKPSTAGKATFGGKLLACIVTLQRDGRSSM
jgi:hypothetical protein